MRNLAKTLAADILDEYGIDASAKPRRIVREIDECLQMLFRVFGRLPGIEKRLNIIHRDRLANARRLYA